MPGITGIITKNPHEEVGTKLQTMTGSMLHEPFYKSGSFIELDSIYGGRAGKSRKFFAGRWSIPPGLPGDIRQ